MDLKEYCPRNTFEKNVKILQFFGLQPAEQYRKLWKFRVYFWFSLFSVPLILSLICNILLSGISDLDSLQDIFFVGEVLAHASKVITFIRYQRFIKEKIIDIWRSEIFNTHTNLEVKFLQSAFLEYKVIFWGFTICICFTSISGIIRPFLQTTRELPFRISMPFDALTDTNIYILSSVYIHLAYFYIAFTTGTLDTIQVGFMLQSGTQLRLVKNRLQNMEEYVKEDLNKLSSDPDSSQQLALYNKMVYKRISKCIDHHSSIVEYTNDLENIFSLPIFIEVFAHVMLFSVMILRLSNTPMFSSDFLITAYDMFPFLVQIYLYCYYGTLLEYESETIKDAIFMSSWYNYDEKSKKLLLILMERLKKPIKLTAGNILDISLDTFKTILQRTSSLFAVLKTFNVEPAN